MMEILKEPTSPSGLIFNIQRYSIHDGPGIRTTVFFSGCPLRCLWCSNPESHSAVPVLSVYPSKCLTACKCSLCVKVCPAAQNSAQPVAFDGGGKILTLKTVPECSDCLRCADICPPRAIKQWGEYFTVPALMDIILRDRDFYARSGGGVTLSGGEVMSQPEFAAALLSECVAAGIHTCIETSLHCSPETLDTVVPHCDLVIADIKHMDTEKHREFTGVGNELILSNLRRLKNYEKSVIIRTPVVPGYTDSEENLMAAGAFIARELSGLVLQYQLLPFRPLGEEKYDALGREYPMRGLEYDRAALQTEITSLAEKVKNITGITAVCGADESLA